MPPLPPTSSRRGVTLVELVIVVMVMSILAAAAAPKFFDSLVFHRAESAALRLKADFELARHTARLTSATQTLTFTNSSYTVTGTNSFNTPGTVYFIDLAATPYDLDGVTLNLSGETAISFDGYGKPSRGGNIVLAAKRHRRTVALDATTGEITITSSQVSN